MFAEPPWTPAVQVHESVRAAPSGSADLLSASLGQDGTELRLTVKLRGRPLPGALCVRLATVPLCLDEGPVLQRDGVPVRASVTVRQNTLEAQFTPAAVGLEFGQFAWSVETAEDRIPVVGSIPSRAVPFAATRCFGAAARDPWKPCENPALRRVVTPTPSRALLTPNAPCELMQRAALVSPCLFGVPGGERVALVGDSHAEHWRAALEVVAQARSWRGVSITLTGCPFNARPARLPTGALTAACGRWSRDVRRWFVRNRDVRTVFVSANSASAFDGDAGAGYRAAWRGLPASVRRIYVLRDTPRIVRPQAECVSRLLRRKRPIGWRCAQARRENLPPDPHAEAARDADSRVRVLDLSVLMCSQRLCPAVIGGVLVRKDGTHLTRAFSATLGAFVLRALRAPNSRGA